MTIELARGVFYVSKTIIYLFICKKNITVKTKDQQTMMDTVVFVSASVLKVFWDKILKELAQTDNYLHI